MRRSPSCWPAASPISPLASGWSPPLLLPCCCPGRAAPCGPAGPAGLVGCWARKLRSSSCCWRCISSRMPRIICCASLDPCCGICPGRAMRRFSSMFCSCDNSSRAWSRAPLRASSRARSSMRCRSRLLITFDGSTGCSILVRIARHVFGERLQIAVERLLQLLHQPLDLRVGRVFGERVLQLLLQAPQLALGERHASVLDAQRGVPQQLLDLGDRARVVVDRRSRCCGEAQREDRRRYRRGRAPAARADRRGSRPPLEREPGIVRQLLALVDDRARDRMVEVAFRQLHPDRLALAGLAERVGGDEPDLDRQAGPGMRRQIVIAGRLRLFQVQPGQRQLELDRLLGDCRPRAGSPP